MDINDLKVTPSHNKGVDVYIRDKSGNETDIVFKIAGTYSEVALIAGAEYERQKILLISQDSYSVESDFQLRVNFMADLIIDWSGIESDGKALKFSKETARDLLANAPYIVDQVYIASNKLENFTNG
jgi:hypothetical protein